MAAVEKRVTLTSGDARFILSPARGRFDILMPGKGGIRRATAGVSTCPDGETLTLADCALAAVSHVENTLTAVYRSKGAELDLAVAPASRPGAFEITVAFTNDSSCDVSVKALLPLCFDDSSRLDLGIPESRVRVYRNGWYAGDVSRVHALFEPHMENACDDGLWFDGDVEVKGLVRSAGMTQVRGKGFYLTAGFLSATRQFGILSIAARGASGVALSAAAIADGKPIAPGRRYFSEPLYVSLSDDYATAFSDYASLVAERMEARRFPEQPSGWCSWYYYFHKVTEADCLENLSWLRANRDALPISFFEIDDGWQSDIGDWEGNAKFPRGMKALADDIRAAGFTPGLWFTPFIISGTSRVFSEHPDWVVKDDAGAPKVVARNWDKDLYALDLTNPYVLGYVAGITGRICYDWGYDYIKIDFVPLGAVRGHRQDDTKTRAQVIRRGLEVVRQNAKPDTYILGCGAPLEVSGGLVDGQRVSMDVSARWDGPYSVLVSSWALTRWWMHGLLWHNDPDCVLVRKERSRLTEAEAQTLANMVMLSGGLHVASDNLAVLEPERLAMLAAMFPASTTPAVPLDLYEKARPSIYFAPGDRILLGVFNWDDEPRTFKVNPRRILGGIPADTIVDFRTDESGPVPKGTVEIRLDPHASRVLVFRKEEPQKG